MTESRAVQKVELQDLVRTWVSQGLGAERGGRESVRADSRLLVSFPDGGDMGKSREEGDMLGISSRGLQRSLEHVGSVCGDQEGGWAWSRGIYLVTSVVSLISGPVPAAEPRGLLGVTSGSCSSAGRASAASPPLTPVPSSPPAWRWKQTS